MKKRWFAVFAVFMAVLLLSCMVVLGGCDTTDPVDDDDDDNGAPAPDPDPEPTFQTFRVIMGARPISMDLFDHRTRISQTLHRMFSEGIVWARPDGSLAMDLAESITMIDEVTYEIKLKQGVKFHNGDTMNADDFIYSGTRLAIEGGLDGETSPRRALAGPVQEFQRIDDYTVRVILERPNTILQVRNWYHWDIMPKNYHEEVGKDGWAQQPIGLGPFKWVEGDFNAQVVLERFEDYHGGSADIQGNVSRVPMLDRVIVSFVEEPTTRVAALLAGDADFIQDVPYDSIALLENNPRTKVLSTPGTNIVSLTINHNIPPFDDKRVRQAIAYAIDYDTLVDQLLLGFADPLYGRPLDEPFQGEAGHGQFNDITGVGHDLEKARALLEDAGITSLSTVIDTWGEYAEQAQAVAQMLSEVGIDASVRVWDYGVMMQEWREGTRTMAYMRQGNGRKSPQWIDGFMGSGGAHQYWMGYWSDPYWDELVAKALPMADGPERNDIFRELYEIAMDEAVVINVHVPRVVEAVAANVQNFNVCSQGRINLHKVYFD